MQNINLDADYIIHDLNKAIALLRIGFMKVSESPHTDESVVMRATFQLLEILEINICNRMKDGSSMNKQKQDRLNHIQLTGIKPDEHLDAVNIINELEEIQGVNDDIIELVTRQNEAIEAIIQKLIKRIASNY